MIDEKKDRRNKSESKVCFYSFCIYGDFDGIIRQSAVLEGCHGAELKRRRKISD